MKKNNSSIDVQFMNSINELIIDDKFHQDLKNAFSSEGHDAEEFIASSFMGSDECKYDEEFKEFIDSRSNYSVATPEKSIKTYNKLKPKRHKNPKNEKKKSNFNKILKFIFG